MSAAGKITLLVIVAALAVLAWVLKRSDVYLMTLCCVYLMATMGLNLTVGYAGQMSLGQAAFFGIGAYHAAILLKLGAYGFIRAEKPTTHDQLTAATPRAIRLAASD